MQEGKKRARSSPEAFCQHPGSLARLCQERLIKATTVGQVSRSDLEVPATAAVDGAVKWARVPNLGRQLGDNCCLLMGTRPPCSWVPSLVSQQCGQAFFLQRLRTVEQCTNHATACDSPVQTASHFFIPVTTLVDLTCPGETSVSW